MPRRGEGARTQQRRLHHICHGWAGSVVRIVALDLQARAADASGATLSPAAREPSREVSPMRPSSSHERAARAPNLEHVTNGRHARSERGCDGVRKLGVRCKSGEEAGELDGPPTAEYGARCTQRPTPQSPTASTVSYVRVPTAPGRAPRRPPYWTAAVAAARSFSRRRSQGAGRARCRRRKTT